MRIVTAACVAGLFFSCVVFEPEPPGLRRIGVDTVYETSFPIWSSVHVPPMYNKMDTVVLDSFLFAGPGGNPLLDSVVYQLGYRNLWVFDLMVYAHIRTPFRWYLLDSGFAGAPKAPPETLATDTGTLDVIVDSALMIGGDSGPVDTIFGQKVVYPNARPYVGLMPPGDTLFAEIRYPDSLLGPLPVFNPAGDTLVLDSSSWPGPEQLNGAWDALSLLWSWGADSLGGVSGTFRISDGLGTAARAYSISRVFRNLAPPGDSAADHWRIRSGPNGFLDLGSLFTLSTRPMPGDSTAHLRSLFSLQGDFEAEVTVHFAANVVNGYTIALFASADTAPEFLFARIPPDTVGGYFLASEGAGLCFNVLQMGGTSASTRQTLFSFGDQINRSRVSMARSARLRLRRLGDRFSIYKRDAGAAAYALLADFPANAGTAYPPRVRLNLAVGNYHPSQAISVEWDDFVILKGKVAP